MGLWLSADDSTSGPCFEPSMNQMRGAGRPLDHPSCAQLPFPLSLSSPSSPTLLAHRLRRRRRLWENCGRWTATAYCALASRGLCVMLTQDERTCCTILHPTACMLNRLSVIVAPFLRSPSLSRGISSAAFTATMSGTRYRRRGDFRRAHTGTHIP